MKVALLSDIHGNLEAFSRVLEFVSDVENIVLLGDNIDYCPHSNEVVSLIREKLGSRIVCSIWGNHEMMILNRDYSTFELGRGVSCAMYTESILTDDAVRYLTDEICHNGSIEFELAGRKCLAVHGSLDDPYWGTIEQGGEFSGYGKYDFVFSGHSHIPHSFEVYYPAEDEKRRNRKKTIFVNPGSVGQPRNQNPLSQFAILDTETEEIIFRKVPYDIQKEQAAFSEEVDEFYRDRLTYGV